jgi:serralysin
VYGGSSNENVVNFGVIDTGRGFFDDRPVALGFGDDRFDNRQGVVNGDVLGGFGNDTLLGGAGAERLFGEQDNDRLDGNGGDDLLDGGAGDDTLRGGDGNDTMVGGTGDDIYHVDAHGDAVVEEADGGADTVHCTIANGVYRLSGEVENLILDSGNAVGKGNAGDNTIVGNANDNALGGGGGDDTVEGQDGNDLLYGGHGRDTLDGGDGDDMLFGQDGDDRMIGGQGNDIFFVDSVGDKVVEHAGQGVDTVRSSIAGGVYALPSEVENLILESGNAVVHGNALDNAINGNAAGNALGGNAGNDTLHGLDGNDALYGGQDDDALYGGNGNDRLFGQAGNDVLAGGAGRDAFLFNTALNGLTSVDTITDFNVADDTIHLENAFFTGLANGLLAAGAFRIGAAAADADDRIIYNNATGALFHDADGTGALAAVQFAQLTPGLALTNGDFIVF